MGRISRVTWSRSVCLVAVALLTGAVVVPAAATPPGDNGKFVAVTDGWIEVVDPDDGSSQRLVQGSQPAWSPDGGRIAFVREEAPNVFVVWVVETDGTGERRLGPGGTPAWSPDGRYLAVVVDGRIFITHSDGTVIRPLTEGFRPDWAPDCSAIAFISGAEDHEYEMHRLDRGIFTIRPDGTDRRRLTPEDRSLRSGDPSWSPDARSIAFSTLSGNFGAPTNPVRYQNVWAMDADGGNRRPVAGSEDVEGGGGQWDATTPLWAPDGSVIAYYQSPRNPHVSDNEDAVPGTNTVRPDKTDKRRILDDVWARAWQSLPRQGASAPECQIHPVPPSPVAPPAAPAAADPVPAPAPEEASDESVPEPTPAPQVTPAVAFDPPEEGSGSRLLPLLGLGLGLAAAGGGLWLYRRTGA